MSESKHTSALYSVQTRWFWCNARIQCWSSVSRQRLNASGQGLYYEEDYYQYVALEVCYANDCAQLASSWKWKWSDVWPIIVTHTRNLCSAFNPSKWTHTHIHTHTHTHTMNTHPEQWAANAAAPGEQLGFGALLKGITSVVVLRIERVLDIHSFHLQSLLDQRLNPRPLGYKSDSLSLDHDCPDRN